MMGSFQDMRERGPSLANIFHTHDAWSETHDPFRVWGGVLGSFLSCNYSTL